MATKSQYFGKSKKTKKRAKKAPAKPKTNVFATNSKTRYNNYGQLYNGAAQLYKDVQLLKSMINAEKKRIEGNVNYTTIGQCNGNADTGYLITDITPAVAVGTNLNQRTGSSIKLSSMWLRMQFSHMSSAVSPVNLRIYVIRVKGDAQTVNATLANKFLVADTISTYTDYNSYRNPDYFKDFEVLLDKKIKMEPDQFSGQMMVKDVNYIISFKYRDGHIRYDQNTTNTSSGQLVLLIVSSNGNKSASTAQTTSGNVVNSGINTGQAVSASIKSYYFDN